MQFACSVLPDITGHRHTDPGSVPHGTLGPTEDGKKRTERRNDRGWGFGRKMKKLEGRGEKERREGYLEMNQERKDKGKPISKPSASPINTVSQTEQGCSHRHRFRF
ncbi:hypothetical protein VZT92_004653 [Zoarces viviparus]|uniref:Uncharacterized protein n=1 Tax=Zoarces viviparus TaxID=48416 RepID=A0AAW1FXE8_ZOAVI